MGKGNWRHAKSWGWRRSMQTWITGVVAMLLMFVVGGHVAHAQAIRGKIVSVGIGGIEGQGGLYRAGSFVPVQVRLENRSGKQFAGRLGIECKDLDGDKVVYVGAKFVLQST